MRYSVLTTFNPRRQFNPAKLEDLLEFRYFLENRQWRNNCPFYLEDRYEDIPNMCKDRYTKFMLSKL